MPKYKFKRLGEIKPGQDGAICGNYIFRLDAEGYCTVFDLPTFRELSRFALDGREVIKPHSNSVCFGADDGHEFPLLYTNVYNTYAKSADRHEGECCVYRISRTGESFCSRLVAIIKIAFAHERGIWLSDEGEDIRPYGNFTVDKNGGRLYAFTMQDRTRVTKMFEFKLPKIEGAGEGVTEIILGESDIISSFTLPYTHYMQGAAFAGGKIYSLEGFLHDEENPPRIRIFDIGRKCQSELIELEEYGLYDEPEMIDVLDGKVYYGECEGAVFEIEGLI